MNPQDRQNIRTQTQQNHQQGVNILNYYNQTILQLLQIIEQLQPELENLKRENQRLNNVKQENDQLREQTVILRQQLQALGEQYNTLKADFDLKKKEFCTFSSVCAKKINCLEEENAKLENAVKELEKMLKLEVEVNREKLKSLESENRNLKNERDAFKRELDEFKKHYNDVLIEYRTYKDTSEARIKDLIDRLAILEQRVNELQVDRNVLEIIGKLQVHLHCGSCQFATTCENYRACERCIELNQEFDRLRADSEVERNRHENEINELNERIIGRDRQLDRIRADQDASEREVSRLNAERQTLADELRRARRDLTDSESQNGELIQDANRNLRRIQDITSSIQRLDKTIRKIRLEQEQRANTNVIVNCTHCCNHKSYVCAHLNERFREFYEKLRNLLSQLLARYPRDALVESSLFALNEFKNRCDVHEIH